MRKLHPEKNSKYAQISFYTILTVVIIFILTRIFDHLPAFFGAVGGGLHWLGVILQPLITGFFIAYLLYPLTNFLQRQLKKIPGWNSRKKLTRGLAVIFTVVIAFAVIFILMTLLISTVTQELHAVRLDDFGNFLTGLADTIRSFFETLSKWLESMSIGSENLVKVADKISGWGTSVAQNMGETLLNYVSKIPSFLTGAMFAVIFAIYFQLDGEGLKHYWKRVYRAITNEKIYSATRILIGDADRVFSGYIRGQSIDALIVGLLSSVSLLIAGVPYAVVIGILTGIGNLVPYVGPIVGFSSLIIVCLAEGSWIHLLIGGIILAVVMFIDGNIIGPRMLSSNVEVHPVLVIVALLAGGKVGGVVGMLVAVPVAALLKLQFDRFVAKKKQAKEA